MQPKDLLKFKQKGDNSAKWLGKPITREEAMNYTATEIQASVAERLREQMTRDLMTNVWSQTNSASTHPIFTSSMSPQNNLHSLNPAFQNSFPYKLGGTA